jgi:hypothetical protein
VQEALKALRGFVKLKNLGSWILFIVAPLSITAGAEQPIPQTFWGIHTHFPASFPIQVPFGQWRAWDSGAGVQWQIMSTCPAPHTDAQCQANPSLSALDWTMIDTYLAELKKAGINNVFYTLPLLSKLTENAVRSR